MTNTPQTFTFGDSPRLCAELLALVRSGRKTATCEALRVFEAEPEAMPQVGRRDIALNWDGTPALEIETTEVTLCRFDEVTVWLRGNQPKAPERLVRETEAAQIRLETATRLLNVRSAENGLHVQVENPTGKRTCDLHHLMLSIGRVPRSDLYVELTGADVLPRDIVTNIGGLFLAGDLIRRRDRFVATAMGDGQRAARNALEFLEKKE